MDLAQKVKSLREAKRLSVAELAEATSVSKPYIWQIESGRRANPTGEIMRKLASALGTTVSDLAGVPEEYSEETMAKVPKALRDLARKRGKEIGLRHEDLDMLKSIHFRGRRPEKQEDWELIFLFLKRILG
ncbi:MAG: helix-turn-helix domain-containing protein [Candidatus Hydrogenedentes bacterium]|nr:helix-turn-helix domain-containing protein [Candidatus Hydrogenedentota bacterium]